MQELNQADLARLLGDDPNPLFSVDRDCNLLYTNAAAQALLRSVIPLGEVIIPEDWRSLIAQVAQCGKSESIEARVGTQVYALNFVSAGTVINIYGHNITLSKESEARYRQMFEGNQAVMLLIDPESGAIVDANPSACQFYGYDRATLQTLNMAQINVITPEVLPATADPDAQEFSEVRHRLASGDIRYVEVHSSPIDVNGKPLLFSIIHDMTTRHTTEIALTNSEERLRSLIASMDELVFSLDLEGRFLVYHQMNRVMHDTPVMPTNPLIGRHFQEVLPTAVAERFVAAIDHVTKTLETFQLDYSIKTSDEDRFFSARISPLVRSGTGLDLMGVTVVSRDVTEAVLATQRQQRLFDLEQLHRFINSLFWNPDEIDKGLNRTLALVGGFFNIGKAYVVQIHEGERLMDMTHEWCASGVVSQIEEMKNIAYDDLIPSFVPMLIREGIISPRHIDDLPLDFRNMLAAWDIQTVLIMPLYVDRRLVGYVGFNEMHLARQWLPEEIATIRTIAESYSRALERSRAQHALIQARDAALRSAHLKSQFMSNMSHEIRTPMSGVIGMLELLLEADMESEHHEFATTAYNSAHNLLSILDDILDFSKIDAGKIVLEMKPIELRHIMSEVRTTLATQAARKDIELIEEVSDDVPKRVFGDPTRVRQVLINLASNAIKFTHEGSVKMRVQQIGVVMGRAHLQFDVIDTGIGIAQDQQQRIFESFIQADGSTTRRYGGSGLGLAICKQLVQLMGGQISVQSEPGQGSTFSFTLTLPLATAKSGANPAAMGTLHLAVVDSDVTARYVLAQQLRMWGTHVIELGKLDHVPAAVEDAIGNGQPLDVVFFHSTLPIPDQERLISSLRAKLGEKKPLLVAIMDIDNVTFKEGTFDFQVHRPVQQSELYDLLSGLRPLEEEPLPAPTVSDPRAARILLAEDQPTTQKVVTYALQGEGYKVDVACDGVEVLELLKQGDYDLILMDVHMPNMDGLTATRHIRQLEGPKSKIPVIALTASIMPDEQQQYFDAGMNAVWGKPFALDQLRSSVRHWTSHTE